MSSTTRLGLLTTDSVLPRPGSGSVTVQDVCTFTSNGDVTVVDCRAPTIVTDRVLPAGGGSAVSVAGLSFTAPLFANGYAACIRSSGNQTLTENSDTVLVLDTEVYDTHGSMANTAGSRIDIQKTGMYLIEGRYAMEQATDSYLYAYPYLNGSTYIRGGGLCRCSYGSSDFVTVAELTAGDYVQLLAKMDKVSGTTSSNVLFYDTARAPRLACVLLSNIPA